MTLAQAAVELGMTKQGLDYHRKTGHITARKMGRFYMIDPEVARTELATHIYRSNKKEPEEQPQIELAQEQEKDITAPSQTEVGQEEISGNTTPPSDPQ